MNNPNIKIRVHFKESNEYINVMAKELMSLVLHEDMDTYYDKDRLLTTLTNFKNKKDIYNCEVNKVYNYLKG